MSSTNGICTSELSNPYKFALTSVNDTKVENEVLMYPNPVSDILTIQTNEIYGRINVYDISGRCLIERKIDNPIVQFDVSNFKSGIYTDKIILDKQIISGKFIKE